VNAANALRVALGVALGALALALEARAAVVKPPPREAAEAAAPAQPSKRAVPVYDGREEAPTTAGDVALWVPRIVLFPLYLTSEYVLRRPMGALVTTAERDRWPAALVSFFTFGTEHQAGVVPTALFDFGFRPSVGLYGFWDDALARGNDLRFRAAFGGTDWLTAGIADRIHLGGDATVTLRFDWTRRPDGLFAGVGARSLEDDVGRFAFERTEGAALFHVPLGGQNALRTEVGARSVQFLPGTCCDEPSLRSRIREGAYGVPAGLDTGYGLTFQRIQLGLDTRSPRPAAGSGVRLELDLSQLQSLRPAAALSQWTGYGASVGGFLDLTGTGRVLSLQATARFVDPWSETDEIPFTELVQLGHREPMRGFKEGRLIGRSAAAVTLQHEWPIWVSVNGAAQLEVGNVFGPHLEDLAPELLRGSLALGARSAGSDDHFLEVLVGLGTETVQDGFHPTSIRLLVGGNHGF